MSELPGKKAGRNPGGPAYSKSFEASEAVLFEELELAVRWGRPSILLAVYRSQDWQRRAEKTLNANLQRLGQRVISIQAAEEGANVTDVIARVPDRSRVVFFVSGMEKGDQRSEISVYEGLNLNREFFVENQIRVVFWLTEKEALDLPRFAPDFWAFRHRVVEFTRPQTARQSALPAGLLLWHTGESAASGDELAAGIQLREKMLADLPDLNESLSNRLDLLYTLGYLYWCAGDTPRAVGMLTTGLGQLAGIRVPLAESRLREGLAIIHYDLGRHAEALASFKDLAGGEPRDPLLLLNYAIAEHALGHNRESVDLGTRTVQLDANNPRLWNGLGHLHLSIGEIEPAIAAFRQALRLDPANADYHFSLAICHQGLGQQEEAKKQVEAAGQLPGDASPLRGPFKEAITGDAAEALQLLRKALETGQVSASAVRRDANIGLYFEQAEIDALLGGM